MGNHIDPTLGFGSGGLVMILSAEWPTKVGFTLGIVTVISVLRTIIVNCYFSPISHFPGPFWASVTRLYLVYYHLKGAEMKEWHAKYSPILRITPTLLIVDDPTELPKIYRSREEKTGHYSTGSFGEPTIPGIRSHREHVERKRALAPAVRSQQPAYFSPFSGPGQKDYEFTFGFGSRMCLGKSLAMLELYKSPVQFLRTFKVKLVNEKEPAKLVCKGGVFWHEEFYMNLKKRKKV